MRLTPVGSAFIPIARDVLQVQDRLVACLPQDHPLASKVALSAFDLEADLRVFDNLRNTHLLTHDWRNY